MKFSNKIFSIKNDSEFSEAALSTCRYQSTHCIPYRNYLDYMEIDPSKIKRVEEIPFMPVEFFKSHKIISGQTSHIDITFTSSATTGSTPSRHHVTDVSIYKESFLKAFELFYGRADECNIYALLPSYLEREGSSLIYMIDELIKESYDGGFFLYNHDELIDKLQNRDTNHHTILFGVSFALLDLVEYHTLDLSDNLSVMETGGMKGRREELPRKELHSILRSGLNVKSIHSEYGMCEALSQSYSSGDGIFFSPPWMKILTREANDPMEIVKSGKRGIINIIDLANYNSCSFLATQDIGTLYSNGSFTVEGRVDKSETRGCNLLIQ